MTEGEQLIHTFYGAFAQLDAETMVACYHKDVTFEDPAFGELKGRHAGNMWRMLCQSQQGKNFIVRVSEIRADDREGSAEWEAFYTFSKTGRRVHNKIHAAFIIKEGKIIGHRDEFDLYRWAGQAFGVTGKLIGWTPFFRRALQKQTRALLNQYEVKRES